MLLLMGRYWYFIAIGLLLIALGVQHKVMTVRVDTLKNTVASMQLEIDKAAIKAKQLEQQAITITAKYKESLANQFELANNQGRIVAERIKNDKESKNVKLSAAIVGLFNDSKPTNRRKAVAATKPLDVGGTGPVKDYTKPAIILAPEVVEEEPPQAYEHTLNELLLVSAENDANHVKCIAQVVEWQSFWKDVEASFRQVNEQP